MRAVLDEMVVLDIAGNRVHRLNTSARTVWDLCDGRRSVAEIAAELAAAHTLSVDQVITDVERIVDEFEQLGLLVVQS